MPAIRFIFFAVLYFSFTAAVAQFSLKGNITDQESGEPVSYVSVIIHETGRGNYSDENGAYLIAGLKNGRYHVHFTCLGYESKYVDIKIDSANLVLDVALRPTILELNQIILEGEYLKTKIDRLSLNKEVMDQESIFDSQENTLSESLEKIPGVNSINTGVGVSKPVIRGMYGNRIVVNESGVSQEGQQWALDHGLEIDQAEVGQVEIVKGPASLLYGSDGMGGVVNIKPKGAPEINSRSGYIRSFYKSNNSNIGFSGSLAGRGVKNWLRASVSVQDYGDYKVPADTFTYLNFKLPLFDDRLKNTAGQIQSYSLSGGSFRSWGKFSLRASNYFQNAGFFPGAVGIPGAYELRDDGNTRNIDLPYQQVNHFKIGGTGEIFFRHNWLEIEAAYQNNLRQEFSLAHSHGLPTAEDDNLAHQWELQTSTLNAHYHYAIHDSLNLITGISSEYQINQKAGFEFLLPDYSGFQSGIFTFARYDLSEKFSLSGGLRYDYGRNDIEAYSYFDSNQNDTLELVRDSQRSFHNWSGALGFSVLPGHGNLNLKFNIGRSFRLPTVPELSMNGVHHGTSRHEKGDPDLGAEKGIQIDMAANFERKNYLVRLSPYFNYYSNYIYLKPTVQFSPLPDGGQIYAYTQSEAIYSGFEFLAEWHPVKMLHLQGSADYVRTYNPETDLPLPFIPPFETKLEAEADLAEKWWIFLKPHIGLNYNWVAAQERVDRNEATTPGYHLLSLKAGTKTLLFKNELTLTAKINNLTDTRYFKHISRYRILNLPEQGRNFMVSLYYVFSSDRK